jgi:ectoine hydroxylase-related dioxygenase (phytanoyl-CoA dioxygenase family)
MTPTLILTDEQVAFFHREGYLSLPNLAPAEEIPTIRAIYDDLFARRAGRERGDQFDLAGTDEEGKEANLPQILGPSNYAPELKETQAWANATYLMERLLGGELAGQFDHAILKPAGHGAPTPWHQDEAYWDPAVEHASLSVWMPLQDTDERMGCLQFVPHSHKGDIFRHRPIGNDPRVHGLELDDEVDLSQAVSCPLPAGGCTVHAQRTLHYAPGNVSGEPRRAWILMGSLAGKPLDTPLSKPWLEGRQTAREERAKGA